MRLILLLLALLLSCTAADSEPEQPADAGYEFDVVDHEPDVDDAFGPRRD